MALVQCRALEQDLIVNKELAGKYQSDTSQIERAQEQVEERKKEIESILNKGRSNPEF